MTYGPYEQIAVQVHERILTLTLNRPEKLNAFTGKMMHEMIDVFTKVNTDDEVGAVIVTGAGRAFCAGADLIEQGMPRTSGRRLEHMRGVGRSAAALRGIAKPTVAKVNGVAAGAGLSLALGCDLVIASDAARFSAIFVQRGLSIDYGGSWLLPRLVGIHKAKELALLADVIPAADAERVGIVNRVVPAAELDGEVDALVARLLTMAPVALSQTKHLLDQAMSTTFEDAVEAEAMAQVVNLSTPDAKEALRAFMEKRAPEFTGE
jgi:2-(1,2-epoxy-1,2-dihydrophenyl)acetyl-CoA isomerase